MQHKNAKHLTGPQIIKLRRMWEVGINSMEAAKRLGCTDRSVTRRYNAWKKGGPVVVRYERIEIVGHNEMQLTAPVPKRPVPPPNCIPSLTKERLMAGR